jgi:PAT family beta-lactamase induction signal transducer AmpG
MFKGLYLQPRLLLLALLGFFSGLPLALTASTLTAWLADSGVERGAIGLFAAVATPYTLKFLWAPLLDAVPVLARLGRRRGWLLCCQILLVFSILAMAINNPAQHTFIMALLALLLAFASASQDIVIDAYRVENLPPEEQGAGAAMATFGYRVGMLVSGAGALKLADSYGWASAYLIMAALMAGGIIVTLLLPEKITAPILRPASINLRARISNFLRDYVAAPLADFATRPHWLAVLIFIVLYKLGDAFLGAMFNPFLLDIGFSKSQIAEIVKLYGFAATLLGVFAGGALVKRIGMYHTLMLAGFTHMLTNLLLVMQAQLGANEHFLIVSISAENFTGGISTAAFIAYLSALCKLHYTATQYALVSSLAAFGRSWLALPSGYLSLQLGWAGFFAFAALLALPSLLLLYWLQKRSKI